MPGNMQKMMQQAQQIQDKLAEVEAQRKDLRVEGTAGGGVVKVVLSGEFMVQSIEIDQEAVNPDDVGMLQDLIQAAFNEAVTSIQKNNRFSFRRGNRWG